MTDKVQKIRKEIEIVVNRRLNLLNGDYFNLNKEVNGFTNEIMDIIDSLQKEPVSIWHDASEEPDDISNCLIFYGCAESVGHYLHYEPVLYNKKEKAFVTKVYPHPTGYKIEQKSVDGGCVAEVYKDKRDRISISDITRWCYLEDLQNLSNLVRIGKNWKEPVSEELHTAYTKVKEKKLSDKALDFIVKTQEENDYICEQMVEGAGDYCVNNCQNLNRHCVKLFLEKVYKKNKQAKKS